MRVEVALMDKYNAKSLGDDLIFAFSRIIITDSFLGPMTYLIIWIGFVWFLFLFVCLCPIMVPGIGFILWFRP